jgi:hypothetical protein
MSSLRSYIVNIVYLVNNVNHFFRQRNKKPRTFWIPGFFLDHVSKVPSHTKNPNEAAEADLFHIINLVKIRRHCFKNLCFSFRCYMYI